VEWETGNFVEVAAGRYGGSGTVAERRDERQNGNRDYARLIRRETLMCVAGGGTGCAA